MTSGLSFREGNPSALPVNKYVVTPFLDVTQNSTMKTNALRECLWALRNSLFVVFSHISIGKDNNSIYAVAVKFDSAERRLGIL